MEGRPKLSVPTPSMNMTVTVCMRVKGYRERESSRATPGETIIAEGRDSTPARTS